MSDPTAHDRSSNAQPDGAVSREQLSQALEAAIGGDQPGGNRNSTEVVSLYRSAVESVARRCSAEPMMPFQLVVIELVESILLTFFGSRDNGRQDAVWRSIAEPVARSLYDDQPARERLERLWTRLREKHQGAGGDASTPGQEQAP